jgi:uncharacterized protein YndB with AHSA1/START domain
MSGEEVFAFIGDPDRIPDWYILAQSVQHHAPTPDGEARFNVRFVFFGDVFEEVLHWDPPHRYIYLAKGDDFPIKDYIAELSVDMTGPDSGVLTWAIRCNVIEGDANKRVLPVILPELNKVSLEKLAALLGGEFLSIEVNFDGI